MVNLDSMYYVMESLRNNKAANMSMEVTELKVIQSTNEGAKSSGFGFVTLDAVLKLSFAILKTKSGDLFVKWATHDTGNADITKRYVKQVEWVNRETSDELEKAILSEFYKIAGQPPAKSTGIVIGKKDQSVSSNNEPHGGEELPPKSPIIQWRKG